MKIIIPSHFLVFALLLLVRPSLAATVIVVNDTASHAIPSTLYGQMFEDINSGDGGLYAELLQNRAFQQVDVTNQTEALTAWYPIGNASLTVIADSDPVSSALPNSLQFTVPEGTTGTVGFANEGYYGINVNSSWTYNASFFYKFPSTSNSSSFTVAVGLASSDGEELASTSIQLNGAQATWLQVNLTLTPTTTPSSTANNFTITVVDADTAQGQTVNFAMFSLFPPTFKDRANGMRMDIAEALAEMRPSFFRLPGGNNIGQSIATRWQWNATLGPLVNRPGRLGDWGYINTDGLGLMEYLYWCEDVGMIPIMAVYAGYSLDGSSVAEADLTPYIQQAIDQIEFVIGDPATSSAAAMRSALGREEPFNLTYVEIGNEDFASTTYGYRWPDFLGNLTAKFPQLKYIATTRPWSPDIYPTPLQYDVHVYDTPDWFASNSFYYDSFERNGTLYFEGEYASTSTNANDLYGTVSDGRLPYPTVQSAVGEAAFMTGLERNSDIVFAASYAPLLQNVASTQWVYARFRLTQPVFSAGTVYRSTAYYVQQLFSVNRGDVYLPSTLPNSSGTVFWSVTRQNSTSELFIKISNYDSAESELTFELPYDTVAVSGTAQVMQGAQDASNTPDTPNVVAPTTSTVTTGQTFNYTAPPWSVSVLTVQAS